MEDEHHALDKTHTWDLVTLPHGKILVGCRWIYKIKTKSNGFMNRYKAHLVTRGFTQEYGTDCEETFTPIAHLTSIQSLLTAGVSKHWDMWKMDVKNAFLNGNLHDEVYLKPPPGYPSSNISSLDPSVELTQ